MIGAGIGASSSVGVANKLLETEIESTQTQMQNIESNFGGDMRPGGPGMQGDNQDGPGGPGNEKFSGTTSINKVDDINAVVDFTVLGQLLALGLALTIIGSLAACVAIARFSPLEILRERS
ncbi:MAG: hypothetical protein Q4F54_03195 [Coriobacteriia bacterium]|nr:hypothetical protein [Coriobacteriia bacterium]